MSASRRFFHFVGSKKAMSKWKTKFIDADVTMRVTIIACTSEPGTKRGGGAREANGRLYVSPKKLSRANQDPNSGSNLTKERKSGEDGGRSRCLASHTV